MRSNCKQTRAVLRACIVRVLGVNARALALNFRGRREKPLFEAIWRRWSQVTQLMTWVREGSRVRKSIALRADDDARKIPSERVGEYF